MEDENEPLNNIENLTDPIFIRNAGLVIVSPYLEMLFDRSGLLTHNKFTDDESKNKAVHLLEYLATGENGSSENEFVLNKVLCGLPISYPITRGIVLSEDEKALADSLLSAVIEQWSALSQTTIDGLRVSFLQREGKLEQEENYFYLKVEQKSFDMLLDQIPWTIDNIKLSWMQKMIQTAWR